MSSQETMNTDVLVIGSGVAGMMAAIEARRSGTEVVLISKSSLGKEASTAYARASFKPRDTVNLVEMPGYDHEPGKYIEDPSVVEAVDKEALGCIDLLGKLGVPIGTEAGYDGTIVYRPTGSDQTHGGAIILDILGPVLRDMGVKVVENCLITSLMKEEGRVVGARGLWRDRDWLSVYARAVVLATGGAAGIYENTTTSKSILGDGYALALQAGARLTNLEFIHFYPVGLSTPSGQYVHCAPNTLLMEKARLINSKGEDIIQKHYHITLQEGTVLSSTRFEWLPRAVAIESEEGLVLLDLTEVPPDEWERLPERNHKQIRRSGVDMRERPVPILHMGHSFRGGIPINARGQTSLLGLYAAGEVTSGYYAAEKGWGPFPSCLITGAIAGRNAAANLGQGRSLEVGKGTGEKFPNIQALGGKGGKLKAREIQEEIRRLCYRCIGPVKSGPLLEDGLKKLLPLEEAAQELRCENIAALKEALETQAMLLVSRAVMEVTLFRKESRGAHYRSDFPARDDSNWLRPVFASYDAASQKIKIEAGPLL